MSETKDSPLVRRWALDQLSRFSLVGMVLALIGMVCTAGVIAQKPPPVMTAIVFVATAMPLPTQPPPTATPVPTPEPPPIAILAGHSGGIDPGAICPDGLREVDITTDIAQRAKAMLEARGYRIEILAEFDRRLSSTRRDYAPRVFLSLHVDSCINYASGFKVARALYSAIPLEEDRLVRCVTLTYGAASQLPYHEGSITRDMTQYHAFNEIHPNTPGAILEVGFLGADKKILRERRDVLALGVADGLDRFVRGDSCQ